MIRYRLDDLGWYQFEHLAQSLIKVQFGGGIESWGVRGDWGIDAYYDGKINYPTKDIQNEDLFIFQIKFIENANASGAKPDVAVIKAVKAEIYKLKNTPTYSWIKDVDQYVFITNAPLSSKLRIKIKKLFKEVFYDAKVHTHGGSDVCDWLDDNQQIYKSFPQLLSIRDLNHLLSKIVNKHIITRSKIVIEGAREISTVFVPTEAYRNSWETLKNQNFVVLDGPAEVGKTAIANMIALSLVLDGWEAVYCVEPKDILQVFDYQAKQIFIADDAFGTTNYDPAKGRLWEKDLPNILRLLKSNHFMIFTSRKHILERAYEDMDLKDRTKEFPRIGEVIVDANELSVKEKALMLYRHAKSENLLNTSKEIVKRHAKSIVENKNFTPERIRRFVKERLPELCSQSLKGNINKNTLKKEIEDAINNPTERMMKAYDKLSLYHKWFLASLLAIDNEIIISLHELEEAYNNYCPIQDNSTPFHNLISEMTEAFIKKWGFRQEYVEWIHPSYRDLVIDKISEDNTMSKRLLEVASIDILRLAISDAGGKEGKRQLPLLISDAHWSLFKQRCLNLIEESEHEEKITSLLTSLHSSYLNSSNRSVKDKIVAITRIILEKLLKKWNLDKKAIKPETLKEYYKLSLIVTHPLLPSPELKSAWDPAVKEFMKALNAWKKHQKADSRRFNHWIELIKIVKENEPRFLKLYHFPIKYEEKIKNFLNFAEHFLDEKAEKEIYRVKGIEEWTVERWINRPHDVNDDVDIDDVKSIFEGLEELKNDISNTKDLCDTLNFVLEYPEINELSEKLGHKEDEISHKVDRLEEKISNLEFSESSDFEDDSDSSSDSFDVDKLFVDL